MKTKRIMSIILTLVLILTILPAGAAFAEEGDGGEPPEVSAQSEELEPAPDDETILPEDEGIIAPEDEEVIEPETEGTVAPMDDGTIEPMAPVQINVSTYGATQIRISTQGSYVLTGTNTLTSGILIDSNNVDLTLDNVYISATGDALKINYNCAITLIGENTLRSSGIYSGLNVNANRYVTVTSQNGGKLLAENFEGSFGGLNLNTGSTIQIMGNAEVTAKTSSTLPVAMTYAEEGIWIGDNAKLTIDSGSNNTLTIKIGKLSAANTHRWKVTGQAHIAEILNEWIISVKVDPKSVGTISREPINLNAVSGAKAASSGHNSVNVSWANAGIGHGYEVWHATSSGGPFKLVKDVISMDTLSFSHTGLATGSVNYYKIRAYRNDGGTKTYGAYSAVVNAKPALATPGAPKAASSGLTSVKVSWAQVAGASGYEVRRATSSGGTYSVVKTVASGATLSFNNTGLATGKAYYYKVRAYRTVNGAKVFGPLTAAVNAKPVPVKPGAPKAASTGYNSVKVSWSKVTGANGYQVFRSASSGGTYTAVKTVMGNGTVSFKNTGLTSGKVYYYKVRAFRTVNGAKVYGEYSAVVNAKPIPVKPAAPKAASSGSKSVKVSWNKVAGASGYEVMNVTTGTVKNVTGGAKVSWNDAGLTLGKTYSYKVRAYRTVSGVKIYSGYTKVVKAAPKYGTVYWVPNGAVFHVNKNCSTLSKSKTINSGTVAESGKPRVCSVCGG